MKVDTFLDMLNFKNALNILIKAAISIACIFGIYSIFKYLPSIGFVNALEHKTYDLRFQQTHFKPSDDIVLVLVDNDTYKYNKMQPGSLDLPKYVVSNAMSYLNSSGAKQIVFNIQFNDTFIKDKEDQSSVVSTFLKYNNVVSTKKFDYAVNKDDRPGKINGVDDDILKPLMIDLDFTKVQSNERLKDEFFENEFLTYRSFIPLFEQLYPTKRVGFSNLTPQVENVFRTAPLMYRFQYRVPLKSDALPGHYNQSLKSLVDEKNRPIDTEGFLLNSEGYLIPSWHSDYYPNLSLKALMHLNQMKASKTKLTLNNDGSLLINDQKIPLDTNGEYFIKWYNSNYNKEILVKDNKVLDEKIAKLSNNSSIEKTMKETELISLNEQKNQNLQLINAAAKNRPYKEVGLWEVQQEIEKLKKNPQYHSELASLFKDKIVFVGYDLGNAQSTVVTPLGNVPSTILFATVFDNLHQSKQFISKLPNLSQWFIVGFLIVLGVGVSLALSSVWLSILAQTMMVSLYLLACLFAFQQWQIWAEMVTPTIAMIIIFSVVYAFKFFMMGRDYKQEWKNANTDSMTSLYNFRFFNNYLAELIPRCSNMDKKFSLILIDIDHFKKFNDTYGHQAGDEVLRCVAKKLQNSVRTTDKVIRYGGEEMCIILEEIRDRDEEQKSLQIAEEIVKKIAEEAYPISEGVSKHVTISVGVATYPTHAKTIEDLVEFADKGLYRAKENGRNQVGAQFEEGEAPPVVQSPVTSPVTDTVKVEPVVSEQPESPERQPKTDVKNLLADIKKSKPLLAKSETEDSTKEQVKTEDSAKPSELPVDPAPDNALAENEENKDEAVDYQPPTSYHPPDYNPFRNNPFGR